MTPFTSVTGIAAPLRLDNIDTDQIIPSREMKSVSKSGLGAGLFAGWRYTSADSRSPNPDFVLNQPTYQNAVFLLGGKNFGCGSSREHAVWALAEFGIRAIFAESFGSIFRTNCIRNGVLALTLDTSQLAELEARACNPPVPIEVNLQTCRITLPPDGPEKSAINFGFEIGAGDRDKLLNGYDNIDITLKSAAQIDAQRLEHQKRRPWLYGKTK